MGKHRHYRVCIDGKKDHSSGGVFSELFRDWVNEHKNKYITADELYITTSKTVDSIDSIVVFMITRQAKHYIRVLDSIVFFHKDKTSDKFQVIEYECGSKFDLRIPRHKDIYDRLGKMYSPLNIWMYGIGSPNLDP